MTECVIDQTEDQEPGVNDVLWVSETPWPEGIEATAWCYRTWNLQSIDPWGLTDELDALTIPWWMMEPDGDPLFYVPSGNVVAATVMADAGMYKPFEVMQ